MHDVFTMKRFLLLLLALPLVSCQPSVDENKAYIMTTNFIKQELGDACNDIDCLFADYRFDDLKNDTWLIVSHFDYKDDFGAPQRFYYKAKIKYKGTGKWTKMDNWQLEYIKPFEN